MTTNPLVSGGEKEDKLEANSETCLEWSVHFWLIFRCDSCIRSEGQIMFLLADTGGSSVSGLDVSPPQTHPML